MRKFLKILIMPVILIGMFLCLQGAAFGETVEEYLNNLKAPEAQYNTITSPAYLRNNDNYEYIDPKTGELTLVQTDYVLPGINGLDVEIKRIYKSGSANMYDMEAYYDNDNDVWVDYMTNIIFAADMNTYYYEKRYGLGVGWRFSFPSIEIRENSSDGTSFMFFHTETGDVYAIEKESSGGNNIYTLENHPVEDVTIEEDDTYSNG